ncbi:LysR family transcriptional regulator [Curvibacter sp. APW13]|uniref:LysR family transcriptional regulator n=1 Tax=Curvibacter sp. APW13 TaxID=3077236 RepID=UPI0028DD74DD|nr:LysR family transcriptional regulator [Curvibacter sp. APW13]MDT8990369.1 LysR family transcriptional regulator [Curvibacter sp. APW13]
MTATIAQLRHFIALAESGSFTRGADSTRRSQAAFSRSIAELESKLGVALIERQGHRHSLTPIGLTVLEHARQVVAQTDELHQVVQHHVSGDAGHVRIGLGATPAALLTLPLMRHARDYPGGMKIRISRALQDLQLQALRERQLDALVMDLRSIPHANGDLVVQKLCELPTGVLCRAGHPLCRLAEPTLADLKAYPAAGTGVSSSVARHAVERFGPLAHPDSFLSIGSDDVESMLHLASESDVVFVGIVAPAQARLQAGTLVQLPFPMDGLESHLAWVQRAARAPNPVLDDILRLVLRTLSQVAPPAP